MKTHGLYWKTYGRIEWRAKLPAGTGFWPALWMLGTNFDSIGWPGCGEIDAVATFGPCPFCWTGSKTILKWDPIIQTTEQLFSVGPTTLASIPLPGSICDPHTVGGGGLPVGNPIAFAEGVKGVQLARMVADAGVTDSLVSWISDSVAGMVSCSNGRWAETPSDPIWLSKTGCRIELDGNPQRRWLS